MLNCLAARWPNMGNSASFYFNEAIHTNTENKILGLPLLCNSSTCLVLIIQ